MAEDKPGFLSTLRNDPATKALMEAGRNYAAQRATGAVNKVGERLSSSGSGDKDGPSMVDQLKGGAMSGAGEAVSGGKGKLGQIFGGIGGAVKGLFKGKSKGANKRPTNIVEDMLIGAPCSEVYERWMDFQQHAGYMKAVEGIDAGDEDDGETNWKVKVWWSRRSWKATIVDEAPEHRVRWKTEGGKGTVDGVITFTELVPGLTLMLVVIEYRPKGMFEWTANRWRTAGRRVRLDLKHFRRQVMMTTEDADEQPDESSDDTVDQDGPEPTDDAEPTADDSDAGPTEAPETDAEAAEAGADEPDSEPELTEAAVGGIRAPRKPKTPRSNDG